MSGTVVLEIYSTSKNSKKLFRSQQSEDILNIMCKRSNRFYTCIF